MKLRHSFYMALEQAKGDVDDEVTRASGLYAPFHSAHEGYAVIKEELDELWREIMKKPTERSITAMRNEAVQVAAMAVRFLIDTCGYQERFGYADVGPHAPTVADKPVREDGLPGTPDDGNPLPPTGAKTRG